MDKARLVSILGFCIITILIIFIVSLNTTMNFEERKNRKIKEHNKKKIKKSKER